MFGRVTWIPAFAGMTSLDDAPSTLGCQAHYRWLHAGDIAGRRVVAAVRRIPERLHNAKASAKKPMLPSAQFEHHKVAIKMHPESELHCGVARWKCDVPRPDVRQVHLIAARARVHAAVQCSRRTVAERVITDQPNRVRDGFRPFSQRPPRPYRARIIRGRKIQKL